MDFGRGIGFLKVRQLFFDEEKFRGECVNL